MPSISDHTPRKLSEYFEGVTIDEDSLDKAMLVIYQLYKKGVVQADFGTESIYIPESIVNEFFKGRVIADMSKVTDKKQYDSGSWTGRAAKDGYDCDHVLVQFEAGVLARFAEQFENYAKSYLNPDKKPWLVL